MVSQSNEGFVIAKINGIFICSCYAPPRWTIEEYNQMLDKLTDELTDRRPVVIAGDFNAWAAEWGSRLTNPRGSSLLEALAKLNVDLVNEGTSTTFRREGRESIIDVTFCSPSLRRSTNWRVCEGYTHSDHQAIQFRICQTAGSTQRQRTPGERRWKTDHFNKELFIEALRRERPTTTLSTAELTAVLVRACDTTMPRRTEPKNGRRPAYWWNATLSTLRARCLRARRRMMRARTEDDREQCRQALRACKSALKREIRLSKKTCFNELCRDANANPWGSAYRVAMAKINGPAIPAETDPGKLSEIVDGLFPLHERTVWPPTPYGQEGNEMERITIEELLAATKRMRVKKAPGPDGIPNVALKTAIVENPEMFRDSLQVCMDRGHFPSQWKRQKLVLLPKPGKPPGAPSSYRPICLLDTLGKLLERIILNRVTRFTESESGLSTMQFGFRSGKSTMDAIKTVLEVADKARTTKRRGNRFCAVVTLDVRNAFNSASWKAIAAALHAMKVPDYLCRILKSYFEERTLSYNTSEGQKTIPVSAGVPQGSILGPTLWNAMYNGLLTMKLPKGVQIVGFADDITLLIIGETLELVEMLAARAVEMIGRWLTEKMLSIAHQKTEVVLISNCKLTQQAVITVGDHAISSKRGLKLLGVMIDDRLNFNSHVDYICGKAATVSTALSRIMSNSSAISSSRRRLLASVSTSIMRYACPTWITALQTKRNRGRLARTHRLMAMRVVSAYRTISSEAVCVIAGMIPIELLLEEDTQCYRDRGVRGIRKRVRTDTMRKWQQQWDTVEKGRWTHRLITDLSMWVSRKHGEVNFHMTQFLSGHGCFRKYLHRFGHAASPLCPECTDAEETPEHVLFQCPRFELERMEMAANSGDINVHNVIDRMCSDEIAWDAVDKAVVQIMSALQRKWREEQRTTVLGELSLSGNSPSA